MGTKSKIEKSIKRAILEVEKEAEVFLFGSQARGEANPESDWDILILVPHPVDLQEEQKFRHKLLEIELKYGIAISTMLKSHEEWNGRLSVTPLFKNISQEGVLL